MAPTTHRIGVHKSLQNLSQPCPIPPATHHPLHDSPEILWGRHLHSESPGHTPSPKDSCPAPRPNSSNSPGIPKQPHAFLPLPCTGATFHRHLHCHPGTFQSPNWALSPQTAAPLLGPAQPRAPLCTPYLPAGSLRSSWSISCPFLLKISFTYFRQRGREGDREGEKHQCVVASHTPPIGDLTWPTTQACALTGNRTSDSLVHRLVINPRSHTSQGNFLSFSFSFSLPPGPQGHLKKPSEPFQGL